MPAAMPFPEGIAWSFQPTGAFLSIDAVPLQARIFQDSGHIELAGPDLAGTPAVNVIRFAAPAVQTSNAVLRIGKVLSSTALANGLELKQSLGAAQITSRLTFALDRVMHYEVTDWGGVVRTATATASASIKSEHFYGFGEKFDDVDQAGKTVHTLTFDHPGNKGDQSYKVAPWFISTRGYGLHLDSSAESTFDMRRAGGRDTSSPTSSDLASSWSRAQGSRMCSRAIPVTPGGRPFRRLGPSGLGSRPTSGAAEARFGMR